MILYFPRQTAGIIRRGFQLTPGDIAHPDARLALCVILATLPVIVDGILLEDFSRRTDAMHSSLRRTPLDFGIIRRIADRHREEDGRILLEGMTLKAELVIYRVVLGAALLVRAV